MIYVPYDYQSSSAKRIVNDPFPAGFIEMGLGKTSITLTAFVDLMAGLEVRAMLVLAPIRVIESVWPDEVAKWDHTKHLRCSIIRGSPISRKITVRDRLLDEAEERMSKPNEGAEAAVRAQADIYLTNYENLPALCKWMIRQKGELPWDMVVFDESTKMKAHNAKRFRMMKPLLPRFKRCVLLTGSPMPNAYLDLWSQFYLLDQGKALGTHFTGFRDRHFTVNQHTHEIKIRPGAAEQIQAAIKPKVICLRSEDYLKLPPIVENIIHLELPKVARKQYDIFRKDLLLKLKTIEVESFNAASLSGKCRQLTSGAVYETVRPGEVSKKTWEAVHDVKLDAVEDVVEEANGESVLVIYEFRHELERLRVRWPKAPWIGGGSKDQDKHIKEWNAGNHRVMIVHPASISYGVNLQQGGRFMVWTSGTHIYDHYVQMLKRLHRMGQTKPVISHMLSVRNTIDEAFQVKQGVKATNMKDFLKVMKTSLI